MEENINAASFLFLEMLPDHSVYSNLVHGRINMHACGRGYKRPYIRVHVVNSCFGRKISTSANLPIHINQSGQV